MSGIYIPTHTLQGRRTPRVAPMQSHAGLPHGRLPPIQSKLHAPPPLLMSTTRRTTDTLEGQDDREDNESISGSRAESPELNDAVDVLELSNSSNEDSSVLRRRRQANQPRRLDSSCERPTLQMDLKDGALGTGKQVRFIDGDDDDDDCSNDDNNDDAMPAKSENDASPRVNGTDNDADAHPALLRRGTHTSV